MNIKSNIPLVGQQQMPVMQAVALVTPELVERLKAWSDKVGLPVNEIQNTIFRLGLVALTAMIREEGFTHEDAMSLIPVTEAEKEAFQKKVN